MFILKLYFFFFSDKFLIVEEQKLKQYKRKIQGNSLNAPLKRLCNTHLPYTCDLR